MPIIPGFGLIKPNRPVILNPNYPEPALCCLFEMVPRDLMGHPVAQSGGVLPVVTKLGAGINSNSTVTYSFASKSGEFTGDMTIVIVWSPLQNTGTYQGLVEKRDGGAEFGVNFRYGVAYQWFVLGPDNILDAGNTNIPAVGTVASSVFRRSNANGLAVFQNGVKLASNAVASTPTASSDNITFGYYAGTGEPSSIAFLFCAIFKFAMSDGLAIQLSLRPFDLLMPAESWSYKKPAAAASTIVFRKTLSQIGGRVGTRQPIGWGM